jgi:hypothetical protein
LMSVAPTLLTGPALLPAKCHVRVSGGSG